jgi:hypothetical protein
MTGGHHPVWLGFGGFIGDTPKTLDGLVHGKSENRIDDLGLPAF